MHLFVTDMCAHSHNIFFVSSSDSTPLLLIYFFLLNLFIFTIHCSFILFFFVSYFLFIFTRNSLSFVLFIYTVSIIQLILLVIMLLWWWWLFLLFFFFSGKRRDEKEMNLKSKKITEFELFRALRHFYFFDSFPGSETIETDCDVINCGISSANNTNKKERLCLCVRETHTHGHIRHTL